MAIIHGGGLSGIPPLNDCLRDPALMRAWGVEKAATINSPVGKIEAPLVQFEWGGDEYEIYRHPLFFISEDVKAWFNSYAVSDYTAKQTYLESNYLWFDALSVYKKALEKYSK